MCYHCSCKECMPLNGNKLHTQLINQRNLVYLCRYLLKLFHSLLGQSLSVTPQSAQKFPQDTLHSHTMVDLDCSLSNDCLVSSFLVSCTYSLNTFRRSIFIQKPLHMNQTHYKRHMEGFYAWCLCSEALGVYREELS